MGEILYDWDLPAAQALGKRFVDAFNEQWDGVPEWLRARVGIKPAEVRAFLKRAAVRLAEQGKRLPEVKAARSAGEPEADCGCEV